MKTRTGWTAALAGLWPEPIRRALAAMGRDAQEGTDEIRLRCGRPLMIGKGTEDFYLFADGRLQKTPEGALTVSAETIERVFAAACQYSVYAYEEEMRQGFITLKGGYRLGLSGKVTARNGKICALSHCTGLCVRIMREVKGCADRILPLVQAGETVYSTLIISPPMMGKTTLLRDLVRQISNGGQDAAGKRVCLVDERAELAGCVAGVPQLDVGLRTDVLDGCPKAAGMMMALRSLSPQVLATDELGGEEDAEAVMEAAFAGVKVLATVHGQDENDLMQRRGMRRLIQEQVFDRYLILGKAPGHVIKQLDRRLCIKEQGR